MRILVTGLILFIAFFSGLTYAQKHEENDDTYWDFAEPGYINTSLNFSYDNLRRTYINNSAYLEGKIKDYLIPQLDVEVGILNGISLEFALAYRKIVANANAKSNLKNNGIKTSRSIDGLDAILIGLNVGLIKENKLIPSVYLQNQFYLPKTGYTQFQNDQLGYYPSLYMQNTLNEKTYLVYSLGAGWDGVYPEPSYTFNINPNFTVSDKVILYGDFGGYFSRGINPVTALDVGTIIDLNDILSVDAYFGTQLQSAFKTNFGALNISLYFDAFAE